MLQADYERLPSFVIPVHVVDWGERVKTYVGPVTVSDFDTSNIGPWRHFPDRLHKHMMPVIEGRSERNTGAKAWHIAAENAPGVLQDIQSL